MQLAYYIYFTRSISPERFVFQSVEEMFHLLPKYIAQRGLIEWMQRIY